MSEVYWRILSTARSTLQALPRFVAPDEGGTGRRWRFVIRKAPRWFPEIDSVPQVTIACREDLAAPIEWEIFGHQGSVSYEVYIGLTLPDLPTEEALQERFELRELIQQTLYQPALAAMREAVPGQWDVEHSDSPAAVGASPPQLDQTWQMYTYKVQQLVRAIP